MRMVLLVLLIVFVFFVAYVRYLEAQTVFHPTRELSVTPSQRGLDFEDIFVRTKDNLTIHGWFIKHPQARSTMLYFHGNAGNIGDRMQKILALHRLGFNIFIIDYRGYGRSEGKPSEAGIDEDGRAAYDYLLTRSDVARDKIWVYGASLGGSVAIDLAAHRPLACLIVDSTFSSAADMAKTIYPFIPSFFMSIKMDSVSKIKKITVPKLFFHSPGDELIPIRLARKLYDAAPPPKKFLELQGGHNDNYVVSEDFWIKGVGEFLRGINLI